jgi:hypothetical protein
LLMGVEVQTVDKTLEVRLARTGFAPGNPPPSYAAADSDAWLTINRVWKSGGSVWRDMSSGNFATRSGGPTWKLLRRPRIGLYKSFIPSMDEGWTRWLLEQFEFAYASVRNADIQAGNLRQRFDAIVFPDQPVNDLANGYAKGAMPDEFVGGLGERGAEALREFAAAGGTLIFLNRSADYATQHLGVKVTSVTSAVSNREFYAPGALLNARLETASGWLLGDKIIAGRSALVHVKLGQGHAILFGMRPQYRAQSYRTFKLFFNALLN